MPPSSAKAVQHEYARLASVYDRRWERYVRETARFTLDALPLRPGLELLDVGCGTGWLLASARERIPGMEAVGADLSLEMLRVARRRLGTDARLVVADAERLPFLDASFDSVLSSSSLHFWKNPERGFAEMARVLRDGGTMVVTDWSADRLRMRLLGWLLRRLGRPTGTLFRARELSTLLEASGFARVRVQHRRVSRLWEVHRLVAIRRPA